MKKLTMIKGGVFNQCPNVTIDHIGSDNDTPFSIGMYAFFQVDPNFGANRTEVQFLTLGSNVNSIDKQAFYSYGPRGGLIAYTTRPLDSLKISGSSPDYPTGDTGLAEIIVGEAPID